jgi:uncharacterized protein (DUF488 family)
MTEHPAPQDTEWPQGTIFTVGHSTLALAIERFIRLLQTYRIRRLVDIRTIPRSRHNPQFNDTVLASSLGAANLEYVPCQALGGLRHPSRNSRNTGWRNKSFRGYADYMQTNEFAARLQALVQMSREGCTVILCAVAVPPFARGRRTQYSRHSRNRDSIREGL